MSRTWKIKLICLLLLTNAAQAGEDKGDSAIDDRVVHEEEDAGHDGDNEGAMHEDGDAHDEKFDPVAVMTQLDMDKDGRVTKDELAAMLDIEGETLDEMFSEADASKDDKLDITELSAFLQEGDEDEVEGGEEEEETQDEV